MFDDNPIIVDVNNSKRNKKQKILCVLCKIQLECISFEGLRYKCPRCKNTYQLGYEILEHEDDFESSHEEEADIELSGIESTVGSGVGLLVANDDDEFTTNDNKYTTKSDIPIPKYMKPGPGRKVVEYHE